MFAFRWHLTNWLVLVAFQIAPRGPARDAYHKALNETSAEILRTINGD